ncbi:hypothetical protein DSM104299_00221 [Baekduia alba]|nr:hypothetical protein DSM104299_00221 [Baekduia alba]
MHEALRPHRHRDGFPELPDVRWPSAATRASWLERGAATLDGVPISTLNVEELRAALVRIPQTSWVPETTVRTGLLPGPGMSDADLE